MVSRNWRKLVKKLQRKRRRQKAAKERHEKNAQEELLRKNDPLFQEVLRQQAELEESIKKEEELRHQEEEEQWLRRELIAQEQFRKDKRKQEIQEAKDAAKREELSKELAIREAEKKRRLEEKARLVQLVALEFDKTMEKLENYLEDLDQATPEELNRFVESRPGEKLCEFFAKTNCCCFGLKCSNNHKRPMLSSILLLSHIYSHPLLEESSHKEYSNDDSALELNERDLREDYDDFFEDIVEELKKYGSIKNVMTVRNTLPHMRGNVFVEYDDKRSALRAFTELQGRYYATKPISVQFSNITSWRTAICGLSLIRKCPRGTKCAYLHILKNPGGIFNVSLEDAKPSAAVRSMDGKLAKAIQGTPLLSWDDVIYTPGKERSNFWRWSESPEIEFKETLNCISESRIDERKKHMDTHRHKLNNCKDKKMRDSASPNRQSGRSDRTKNLIPKEFNSSKRKFNEESRDNKKSSHSKLIEYSSKHKAKSSLTCMKHNKNREHFEGSTSSMRRHHRSRDREENRERTCSAENRRSKPRKRSRSPSPSRSVSSSSSLLLHDTSSSLPKNTREKNIPKRKHRKKSH